MSTTDKGTVPETTLTANNRDVLGSIPDQNFVNGYVSDMTHIYNTHNTELTNKLGSRKTLIGKISDITTEYTNRTPVARQKHHLICKDIYILTACLVNRNIDDLDEVYRPPAPHQQDTSQHTDNSSLQLQDNINNNEQCSELATQICNINRELNKLKDKEAQNDLKISKLSEENSQYKEDNINNNANIKRLQAENTDMLLRLKQLEARHVTQQHTPERPSGHTTVQPEGQQSTSDPPHTTPLSTTTVTQTTLDPTRDTQAIASTSPTLPTHDTSQTATTVSTPAARDTPTNTDTPPAVTATASPPVQPTPETSVAPTPIEAASPLLAAPTLEYIFVGGVASSQTTTHVEQFILTRLNINSDHVKAEPMSIRAIGNIAFKVSVPQGKTNLCCSLPWGEIKAEPFRRPRSTAADANQTRGGPQRNNQYARYNPRP